MNSPHSTSTHHDHDHIPNNKKVLIISFILITSFMLIEFIGGFITNSLALLSDAGHMLSDSVALGIALAAVYIGQKASSERKSFGYQRFEVLAAALNGITLIAISIYICIEAIFRFQQPQEIKILGMLVISSIGLMLNIFVAWYMVKNSDTENDLNMQSAYLHVLSDLLGSIGAITAALCLYFFGWEWMDPLISIFVALLVLSSGIRVTRKAVHILMQGTPETFDIPDIRNAILKHPHIISVHDLHIWSLNSKTYVLSCHIVFTSDTDMQTSQDILKELKHQLQSYGIEQVTIQTELEKVSNENGDQHSHTHHHNHQH